MIVLILSGGLGNQMFEYAAARAMALRAETDICLNKRMGFQRDIVYKRVYCLDRFNIHYVTNSILSFDFPFGYIFNKISKKIGRHLFFPWYRYINDNTVDIADLKTNPQKYKNVILEGTWVKQDYFDDYSNVIRNEFTLKDKIPPETYLFIQEIRESEVPIVCMGVRVYQEIKDDILRKDAFFYSQGAFYNEAIDYYKKKYSRFKLYIFTQAQDWVIENIHLDNIEYRFIQTATSDYDAFNDMLIMSMCKDYIIANSSYYWWGVWLNPNEQKVVVISKQWTNSSLYNWIRI